MTTKTKAKTKIMNDPEKEQVIVVKDDKPTDVEYIGNKLADISARLLIVETTMVTLENSLKRVMGRMGL